MPIRALAAALPDTVCAFLDHHAAARGRRHWQWKYARRVEVPPAGFFWQEADGEVLGFIGLMRSTLRADAAAHPAAWFVDWHVAPGQRGVGVGVGLLRKAEAAANILLTLQGSADTRQILPRLGWKESLAPATWVRPLSARYWSDHAARHAPAGLRSVARLSGAAASAVLRGRAPGAPSGAALLAVDRCPPEYDAVWAVRAAEFAPLLARDSAYLNWLCADYPEGGYRLQLVQRHGDVVGHLIVRLDTDRGGLRRGRLVDVLWPRPHAELAAWLVAAAVWQLQADGADYVECVLSAPDLEAAARRSRFRRRASVPLWYRRLPAGMAGVDDWYITFLDCDRAYR